MTQANTKQGYIFGGNTGLTYDQVQKRRKVADSMLQSTQGVPKNGWEGANALMSALMARRINKKADAREGQLRDDYQSQLASVLGGGGSQPTGLTPGIDSGGREQDSHNARPPHSEHQGIANDAMATIGRSSPNAQSIKAGLVTRGLPEHIAEGFVMNFQDESGLNPGINEANPIVPGSRGGFGLYQLTGPRRREYEAFAQSRNVDPSDVDAQLDFLMKELSGSEKSAAQTILSTQDAGSAAQAIVSKFLRPSEEHRARRSARYGGHQQQRQGQSQGQQNGPDLMQLVSLANNPMATQMDKTLVSALIQRSIAAGQPMDPYKAAQLEKLQLENNALQNPAAPEMNIEKLADNRSYYVDPTGQQPPRLVNPDVVPAADPQFRPLAPDEVSGIPNLDPTKAWQVGPDGRVSAIGGGGVNVTVNPNAPQADTNAPRDAGQFAKKLSDADAATITEERTRARSAGDIESLANQLETVIGKVGYTGPGGEVYGKVDDAIGILPGDSGARGAFRSMAMEAQLSFTEKTSGAITDREMGMFKTAAPNLTQTEDGNSQIIEVMRAGAARVQARAQFMERFAQANGSLENAQAAWARFMDDNPMIESTPQGLKVMQSGDFNPYLTTQAGGSVGLGGAPTNGQTTLRFNPDTGDFE
ncbi:MAG: phage tail tip lysozyme [Litoreibacter sp.]